MPRVRFSFAAAGRATPRAGPLPDVPQRADRDPRFRLVRGGLAEPARQGRALRRHEPCSWLSGTGCTLVRSRIAFAGSRIP